MDQENEKKEVRVEDRRFFDNQGNPIHQGESEPVQEPPAPSAAASEQKQESRPVPKIDFVSLVFLYAQTAMVHFGELEDPSGQKATQNLDAAKQMIDILELLQQKTRGNLTSQEDQYLQGVLFDLRMRYVERSKKP